MTCKECKFGKYNKKTGTIFCRYYNKTLIFDRCGNCGVYELKTEIKKCRERMKERDKDEQA